MNARTFDTYLRSATTAAIALAIVGAAIYSALFSVTQDSFLIGAGGIVIGFYFGAHVSLNGSASRKPPHVDVHVDPKLPQES